MLNNRRPSALQIPSAQCGELTQVPRYSWEGTDSTNCLSLLKPGYNQENKCPGLPPSRQTNDVTVFAATRSLRRHGSRASPKHRTGAPVSKRRLPNQMYNDAGESSPPPKSLLTVRPPGAGGSKVQKPASENHRSSPEHRPGRFAHVQNRAKLGVSRPSDGSSRAAR
ncbi:hypothetical protein NDU88_002949 [Pleurodeles waltl]|uniref:Uncharacterized protein n=1 Tax=Pleurodeles waltl TaxID=8319 RepID=A0AAV7T3N3_PLEWA|nr:hypothetical protein NDU88_002949 [Pleurodeles waltl]